MASSESTKDERNMPPSRVTGKSGDRRIKQHKSSPKRRVTDTEWKRWTDRVRDVIFLALGAAAAFNQLFLANPPNPVLYPVIAALLGAPIAFALDDRRKNGENDQNETD